MSGSYTAQAEPRLVQALITRRFLVVIGYLRDREALL
jgi:hypothetical protein